MFADAVRCTHNGTGGSGTLTLASVSGYPQPTDVFSTSGTRIVYYEIAEYTDSTFATLSKYERGVGSLVLSTNVLTRSTPFATWTSGGSYASTGASALSFGNTAANIQIILGASAVTQRPAMPVAPKAFGGTNYLPFNTRQTFDSSAAAAGMTNGRIYYVPVEYIGGTPITSIAMECTTLGGSAAVRVGLYDWDTDGMAGNLLKEFTSGTQLDFSSTGIKSVTPAAALWVPPGWYWLGIQGNNSTAQMRVCTLNCSSGIEFSSTRDLIYYYKDTTYGALPSTGDKTPTNVISRSSGNPPWVGYK